MASKQESALPGCLVLIVLFFMVKSCFSDDPEEKTKPSASSSYNAPAPSSEVKSASDFVATIINLNGHLCAQVIDVTPHGGSDFVVTCIQNRDGSGRVRYLVNGDANTARPL